MRDDHLKSEIVSARLAVTENNKKVETILAVRAEAERKRPAALPYLPADASRPLLYPANAERDWSRPSKEPTQDVAGYKIPTDPEQRRQYFQDMSDENDRLYKELVKEGRIKE